MQLAPVGSGSPSAYGGSSPRPVTLPGNPPPGPVSLLPPEQKVISSLNAWHSSASVVRPLAETLMLWRGMCVSRCMFRDANLS